MDAIDSDELVTAARAAVILADERITRRTAPLSYWREHAMVQADGGLLFPAAGGVFRVTEASAAAITIYSQNTNQMVRNLLVSVNSPDTQGGDWRIGHRIGRAAITCDGAGAFANQALVPALAGYYGVCRLKSIKANAIVAAGVLTFESPAATPALPSVEAMPALALGVRENRVEVVVTHVTLVDAQAIVVDGAGFGAGTIVNLEWEYWYET